MRSVLLVASREYKQIASTRGFWVMLFLLPIIIIGAQFATQFIRPPASVAYIVVDETGLYDQGVQRRIDLNYQRQVLGDLSSYVQRWKLGDVAPDAPWSKGRRYFFDADVEAFANAGGAEAAGKLLAPRLPSDAAPFRPAAPPFIRIAPPADAPTTQGGEALAKALAPALKGDIVTSEGKRPLVLVVFIPKSFGTSAAPAQMWTNGRPNDVLIETVRGELTRALRANALTASGLPAETAAQISQMTAPISVTAPAQGQGREQVAIRSIAPIVMVYVLLMTVLTTGGMMLQGVIEEKSNKLLEAILACIKPSDLMYGKLIGIGAIGLTIIGVWISFAVAAAFAVQGMVADIVKPSLESLNQPWMIAALLFYFIAGYVLNSMVYLAIGSLSSSLQDAQAFLMPMIFCITMPVAFLMTTALQQPNGALPQVMSWIPLYTPYAMMARMGGGVSMVEVIGTGALLLAFTILAMMLLGRLFQASLLRTGQPPKLGGFIKMMFAKSEPA